MNINKNSWHYKVYQWTYGPHFDPPQETNLCQYTQRIIWVPIINGIVIAIACTLWVVSMPIAWIVGYKPANPNKDPYDPYAKYQGLKIGSKFQLYPWHILFVASVVYLEWYIIFRYAHPIYPLLFQVGLIGAVVLGLSVNWIVNWSINRQIERETRGETKPKSETWQLFKAWMVARKRGICPLVKFTDGPTSEV